MKKLSIVLVILTIIAGTSSAQRKVLVEQFTNSGCPPCAGNTPVVASYVNAHSDSVIMLSYHTSFPYLDSMYFENPTVSNDRVSFYSVSGVPTSRVDGNFFIGNLVPSLSTIIPARQADAPHYRINFINSTINNSQINSTVQFESLVSTNQNETLIAHIVVAEKRVLKNAYLASPGANAESEYPWVVRYMLPNENGSVLTNKQLGGIDQINVSQTLSNVKDLSEVRIIAFAQNINTREVYQAEISNPDNTTQTNEISTDEIQFSIYPSPAKSQVNIHLNKLSNDVVIKISDLIGNVLHSSFANSTDLTFETSSYPNGIYFIQISDGIHKQTKRFIIAK